MRLFVYRGGEPDRAYIEPVTLLSKEVIHRELFMSWNSNINADQGQKGILRFQAPRIVP